MITFLIWLIYFLISRLTKLGIYIVYLSLWAIYVVFKTLTSFFMLPLAYVVITLFCLSVFIIGVLFIMDRNTVVTSISQ